MPTRRSPCHGHSHGALGCFLIFKACFGIFKACFGVVIACFGVVTACFGVVTACIRVFTTRFTFCKFSIWVLIWERIFPPQTYHTFVQYFPGTEHLDAIIYEKASPRTPEGILKSKLREEIRVRKSLLANKVKTSAVRFYPADAAVRFLLQCACFIAFSATAVFKFWQSDSEF